MAKQQRILRLTQKQKAIAYLMQKLGTRTEGRKKLMKLMFLVEHYDPQKGRLVKKGLLKNNFIIYRYGVFSFDVMRDYTSLIKRDIVDERLMRVIHEIPIIDETITSRIDQIVSNFGLESPSNLEGSTLSMLQPPLNKQTKLEHFGEDVIPLIPP